VHSSGSEPCLFIVRVPPQIISFVLNQTTANDSKQRVEKRRLMKALSQKWKKKAAVLCGESVQIME